MIRLAARVGTALIVLVATVLGWASPTISGRADFAPITADRARQLLAAATVQLDVFGCDLQRREGTAVAISADRLLSNRHVVERSRLIDVNPDRGPTAEARLPSVATAGDVAEVDVPGIDLLGLRLSAADPVAGSPVWIAGFASQSPGLVIQRQRVVAVVAGAPFGQPWAVLELSRGVRQGTSGGPVLDASGHLAGIVFGDEVPTGQALAIPASALRALLAASAFVPSRC